MWKSLLVTVIGLVCGLASHMGYFNAYAPACSVVALDCEMEWLREELDLSEEQFASVTRVHSESGKQIKALSRKVRELELMLAELEAERVREGYVDFLEIRSYMEVKQKLDEACAKSTSDLIASVGNLMDMDQRKRYYSIVSSQVN